jgi:hypothetical protein
VRGVTSAFHTNSRKKVRGLKEREGVRSLNDLGKRRGGGGGRCFGGRLMRIRRENGRESCKKHQTGLAAGLVPRELRSSAGRPTVRRVARIARTARTASHPESALGTWGWPSLRWFR